MLLFFCFSIFFLFLSVAQTYDSSDKESAKPLHEKGFSQDNSHIGNESPSGASSEARRNQTDEEKYGCGVNSPKILRALFQTIGLCGSTTIGLCGSTTPPDEMQRCKDAKQQRSFVKARMIALRRHKSKIFLWPRSDASDAYDADLDLIIRSLLIWVQSKTAQNSYVNVTVSRNSSLNAVDNMEFTDMN